MYYCLCGIKTIHENKIASELPQTMESLPCKAVDSVSMVKHNPKPLTQWHRLTSPAVPYDLRLHDLHMLQRPHGTHMTLTPRSHDVLVASSNSDTIAPQPPRVWPCLLAVLIGPELSFSWRQAVAPRGGPQCFAAAHLDSQPCQDSSRLTMLWCRLCVIRSGRATQQPSFSSV